ncbi:P-loop containing nucleoside triphosphate hydrolase protein [Coniella lustricola]|uniref:DNA 3'-5' helicase n=1 Tax=Coniella lustricola TaxID=2025994 RepID=A0A2T3A1H3_9PEZI|nr:P-loop containing nucleoside triphosphate hydrolase protein [Coniella lustricola]
MATTPMSTPRAESLSMLDTLNHAQRRAVCSDASTVAIMAGPGSGKTHTLTSRVVWLVDALAYQPQNVIVATFTVKAAREMRARIGKALSHGRHNKLVLGTFHSISRRYLAAYGAHIGLDQKFGIADDGDSRAILSRICKRLQLSLDPVQARSWISKRKAKGSKWTPTLLGRQRSGEAADFSRAYETCYQEYQDHLQRSNLLDYDDLLVRCVELLQKHPACVSNVQAVLIDEYQDTNGIQYDLMRLLAQKHKRITIVGDPDQSIYGWRSAEIANLRRLFDDFPQTDQISLEENYRSSQAILDTALTVIQQDEKRYKKVLRPVHDRGTRPTLRRLKTSADEAGWIVSEIRRIQMFSGNMMGPEDMAILLRSAALSRQVEAALGKAGIAYRMIGGFKFYERAEIKVLLDYLRVIHQPDNNDALARIINVPKRGIGDTTVKALLEEAEQSSESLWSLLIKHCRGDRIAKTNIKRTVEQRINGELIRLVLDIQKKIRQTPENAPFTLVDIIDEVLTRLSFDKYLRDTYRDDHEQRWANIQEFRLLANDFMRGNAADLDDELPQVDGLEQAEEADILTKFLANVSLASDAQNKGQDQESMPMVTVSTIHAAKGLEWPVVFIPAAYQGSIPHMRSDDTDEERRLLYVAMTRAKVLMYASCPLLSTSYGGQAEVELSSFLEPVAHIFGRIGPSFEPQRLAIMGKILGRQVPTQKSIFDSLPIGVSPNDDLYPEDPTAAQVMGTVKSHWNDPSSGMPPQKRPRLVSTTSNAGAGEDFVPGKYYATTMEQHATFTMASQLEFAAAASHQATPPMTEPGRIVPPTKSSKKGKTTATAGQTTLTGFMQRNSTEIKTEETAFPTQSDLRRPRPDARIPGPLIECGKKPDPLTLNTELARHKIEPVRAAKRMAQAARSPSPTYAGKYVQFSSSPPRPPSPADAARGRTADTTAGFQKSSAGKPHPAPTRAPPSLHNTTFNIQRQAAGVKRPAGLARPHDSAAALQKLRKPFRPLTMNRP